MDNKLQQPRQSDVADLNDCRRGQVFSGFGRFILVLALALGTLCVTPKVFGQAKGLYYGGLAYEFEFLNYIQQSPPFRITARYWSTKDNDWDIKWTKDWASQHIVGSLGACVFNGLLYCFFTTTDNNGTLYYVTVDPATQAITGPTAIAKYMQIYADIPNGAAAAVCGDTMYVFAGGGWIFTSGDGKSYAYRGAGWGGHIGNILLDAVTFYPTDNSPASLMVIYYDALGTLYSWVFAPPDMMGETSTLPWPPVAPCLWGKVDQGNLVLGTVGPGARSPCVQFYGFTRNNNCDGQHLGRWEYNLTNKSWTFYDWTQGGSIYKLGVWPWFDTMDVNYTMRLSHIIEVQFGNTARWYTNRSDWMVPQHYDPVYGWSGAPTVTSTATGDTDDAKKLRALWSLVGIVLGPPPFALNGADDGSGLSQVQYGIDQSQSVTTTHTSSQTISVAMNNKIKAGFGEFNLDLSYAHAWTASHGTTHTVDTSTFYTFGPMDETPPDQGTHGWAIFNAPTFVTQQYKVYAYDYNQSTGAGTYLNQDIYATSVGAVVPQTAYFTLANPSEGAIQDLFQGFPIYPNSTDIAHWFGIRDWNNGGSDWAAIFGDRSNPAVGTLNVGTGITQQYTQTDSTLDSKGNSNSFSISAGASFDAFEGFESGVTVGYDGEFGTETEVESTITKSVSCSLNMPIPPNTPGYVKSMTIQPYWLQAKTANAPWISPGYHGNLPWCITWRVLQYSTVGGATAGTARSPVSASGRIQVGTGNGLDRYKVVAGRLAWVDSDGVETSLPMTADEFDPDHGATVFLNGHAFSAVKGKGMWVRKGDVWKYRTRWGAKDSFLLKLDFANKTWSFDVFTRMLDKEIRTIDDSILVSLDVQGSHWFSQWLKHDVDATWYHKEKKVTWDAYGVHEIKGAYNSQTGVGNLRLEGHIPRHVSSFGDLELRINGALVFIPLLAHDNFLEDVTQERSVKYKRPGLSFEIDFRTGIWKAAIMDNRFKGDMAPKGGEIRVQVLLGGAPISDQTFVIQRHMMALSFNPAP